MPHAAWRAAEALLPRSALTDCARARLIANFDCQRAASAHGPCRGCHCSQIDRIQLLSRLPRQLVDWRSGRFPVVDSSLPVSDVHFATLFGQDGEIATLADLLLPQFIFR